MTDEENNKLSAEIEIVKEKVLFLILKPYSIDNKKEVSGLLNTITALAYRWGLRKGYDKGKQCRYFYLDR